MGARAVVMMATMNADQKACLRAADLIERYGWQKLIFGNKHRGFCIAGAVLIASNDCRVPLPLQRLFGDHSATLWNDCIAESKEEVIDVLIAAAYGDW